jgi:hypothetical protein
MEAYERESLRRLRAMEEFICGPEVELPSGDFKAEFAERRKQLAVDEARLEAGGLSVEELFEIHQRQIADLEWGLRCEVLKWKHRWIWEELQRAYEEEEYLLKLLGKRKVAS